MTQQPKDHTPAHHAQYYAGRGRAEQLYAAGVTPQMIIQEAWHSTEGTVYALAMLERGKELESKELQS